LPRPAIHQLAARQFFDHVGIGMARLHQLDAVGHTVAIALHLHELRLLQAQMGLNVFKLEKAALAPDGVGAEV
jgi:hypothetical protein